MTINIALQNIVLAGIASNMNKAIIMVPQIKAGFLRKNNCPKQTQASIVMHEGMLYKEVFARSPQAADVDEFMKHLNVWTNGMSSLTMQLYGPPVLWGQGVYHFSRL